MTERNDYRRPDPTADETMEATRVENAGAAPAGTSSEPRSWDREEWEGENQRKKADPDLRATLDEAATGEPRWNEGEVVGEGQGGPGEGPTNDILPSEGENQLSGHGHNPGGGERWGDVDRS